VTCLDLTPPGYAGHWRDWHEGHGCDLDPSRPRRPSRDQIERDAVTFGQDLDYAHRPTSPEAAAVELADDLVARIAALPIDTPAAEHLATLVELDLREAFWRGRDDQRRRDRDGAA
jgi:hypothetical protein